MDPLSVILTDMPEVVPLISANILLNSVVMGDAPCQQVLLQRYQAAAYTWGGQLTLPAASPVDSAEGTPLVPYFDTILASDVVYYPEGYAPLLATLCDLLGAADTAVDTAQRIKGPPVCILAHRHRHPEDKNFFDALYATEGLHTEKLDFTVQPTGERDSAAAGEVRALRDVILFKITKK